MDGARNWFALAVKPQHEFRVIEGLKGLGEVEGFRVKVLDGPLFAGYVFARFEYSGLRVPVLRVAGVKSIVGSGSAGSAVGDEEIGAIRTLVNSAFPVRPWPFLHAGQRVRVGYGPLRGAEGIFLEQKDEWRMVVSVELLQRSISVLLDGSVLGNVGAAVH